MYPPGWPALLAPAAALGVPWLVNPLLGGLLAVSVSLLGQELYGVRTGRIAGLLTILSPFVTVISATHLSHTATALFCCLAFWAALRMVRRGDVKWGMIAGLSWGAAFLCRPLTALVLGIVLSLGFLPSWRSLLRHWRSAVIALLLCGVAVLLLAAYQHAITGDPLTPGHKLGLGRFGKLGFGPIDERITHTPRYGAEHTLLRMEAISTRLLGWPISALLLLAAPFLPGRSKRKDWWLLAAPLSLLPVFATFHYYEVFFPGRYLFASVPMLLILAARGWTGIADLLRRAGPAFPAAAAAACIAFAAAVSSPVYFGGYGQDFGDVESLLPRVVEAYAIDDAVVFMDSPGECSSETFWNQDYYGTGFLRNSLDLNGEIVYARSSREKSRRLMDRYPGRSYYLYRYLRCDERVRLYRLTPEGDSFSAQPMPSLIPEVEAQ
jgi:4-amino-4-deoxy-L-arabinose transferase-like glycosyltransferase